MASRIKGITVEIGGDTTKLEQSLKAVNSTIRTTQSQLKDISRLLKLDPTNTELLSQKQAALKEAIGATKDKLDALKTAQSQAKQQMENGTLGRDKYDALQREIIETEQELQRLAKQAADANTALTKIGDAGRKLEAVGTTVTNVGRGLTRKVTAPIAAGAAVAVNKYAEVDKTMTLVNETMGNSEKQAKMLNDAMSEAASNSTFGMSDAANASLNFARAGLDAEQAASALAPAMNLAAGEGGNLDTVSGGLVATINGFHDSFDNAGRYADVFAAACNNSALDVNSLSDSMSVAAPIFSSAGYSVNDAALYMGTMANNGIDANKAANSLKTGLARLVSPAKEGSEMMDKLGISVTNADGSMKGSVQVQRELHDAFARLSESEQIAAASAIFGKNQMAPWLALINTAPDDVTALAVELDGAGFSTEDFAKKLDASGKSADEMKAALAKLGVSGEDFDTALKTSGGSAEQFAENLLEACDSGVGMKDVVAALGGDLDGLQNVMDETRGTTDMMAEAMMSGFGGSIESLKSGVDVLMTNLGRLIAGYLSPLIAKINGVVTWLNGLDDKQKNTIIRIAMIVAAIGPLLLIVGTVITKIGGAMIAIEKLGKSMLLLKTNIANGTGVAGKLATAIGGISAPVVAIVAAIAVLIAAFVHLWKTNEDFRNKVIAIWNRVKTAFSSFASGINERLSAIGLDFKTITETIGKIWDGFCRLLAPVFEGALEKVAIFLETIFGVITGLLDVFIGLFTGNWDQFWTGIKEIVSSILTGIQGVIDTNLATLRGVAEVFFSWFGTSWESVWSGIKTFFEGIWTGITTFLSGVWETIKNVVQVGLMFIGELISAAVNIITLPFQFIWQNCKDYVFEAWEAIKSVVSGALEKLGGIVQTGLTAVKTKVSTIFTAMREIATTIWTGIKAKIAEIVNGVKEKVSSAFGAVKNTTSTIFNNVKSVSSTAWNGVKSAVSTAADNIKSRVNGVFSAVKDKVNNTWDSIKNRTKPVWEGVKSAILTPIEAARDRIKGIVDSIKSFFDNCHISLPHIKLPHFSVSGWFSLDPPSVPHFDISWWKSGGIMTSPTIFGMNGTSLMAGGEAGPEAILPLKGFYKELNSMLSDKLDMSGMEKYLAVIAANSSKGIYLEDGTLVGHLLPSVEAGLAKYVIRGERGNR